MTFDGIRVNHAALQSGAGDLLKGVTDINARLDRLEGDLRPMIDGWSGDQQTAYLAAKTKWETAINEMVALLNETQRAVVASDDSFVQADRSGARLFGA